VKIDHLQLQRPSTHAGSLFVAVHLDKRAVISSTLLSVGASLLKQGAAAPHKVTVDFEVENHTKWSLSTPIAHLKYGVLMEPPVPVLPGTKEGFKARKTSFSLAGSYGTVSWEVTPGWRAVAMWCVPWTHFFGISNELAVGIVVNDGHYGNLAAAMRKDNTGYEDASPYRHHVYSTSSKSIQYCNSDFCVQGIMGTSLNCHVKLSVVPKQTKDLAHSLQEHLGLLG